MIFQHLQERARPAVGDHERSRRRATAAFVDEMDAKILGGAAIVMQRGQRVDVRLPVKAVFPVTADLRM